MRLSRWTALIAIAAVAGAAAIHLRGAIAEPPQATVGLSNAVTSPVSDSSDSSVEVSPNVAQAPVSTLISGSFVTVEQDHPTAGIAQIIEENGQRFIVFDDAFTTARGPAVEVILYKRDSVPVAIAEGDYVSVAMLQSFDGAQRYALPADLDISQYGSIGIWCRQFNVTFGYADLMMTGAS